MNLLISIIDCKIAFLNRIRKYIVDSGLPKACVDEDAKVMHGLKFSFC